MRKITIGLIALAFIASPGLAQWSSDEQYTTDKNSCGAQKTESTCACMKKKQDEYRDFISGQWDENDGDQLNGMYNSYARKVAKSCG